MKKKELLTLAFAFVGALGAVVGGLALVRDIHVDTRNDWKEIYDAMINVKDQRAFVFEEKSQMGAYGFGVPNQYEERLRDYRSAYGQFRGKLDRLNDPLIIELTSFLDANNVQWMTPEYEKQFDEFVRRVEMKSRPK
jgi:hypothetical protein